MQRPRRIALITGNLNVSALLAAISSERYFGTQFDNHPAPTAGTRFEGAPEYKTAPLLGNTHFPGDFIFIPPEPIAQLLRERRSTKGNIRGS